MKIETQDLIYPVSKQQWRAWLEEYHASRDSVWLVQYAKHSNQPSVSWSDAVDEALCFGWIDSIKKKLDADRTVQFFTKRKDKSTWSKINKDKVERLMQASLMAPAGLERIRIAKENGSWELLDTVEALIIPDDLQDALHRSEGAMDFFRHLSKSKRKMLLQWVVLAKRKETRGQRIAEIAACARQGLLPRHF